MSGSPAPPRGLDSRWAIRIIKAMSAVNVRAYRLSGGRIGGKWRVGSAFPRGVPVCLVTTTGRKTGLPRTLPLLFLRDDDRIVLVASQGGLPKNPLWFRNIAAKPDITVQVRRQSRPMRARVASAAERATLWPRLVEMYADFANYQSWTEREIPVVICEPV